MAIVGTGEAGSRGPRVQSDCWMRLEVRDAGGVEIDLQSTVEWAYGDAIRAQLREGLEQLGIAHARLTVVDVGALPFAIAARLEAAARRALPELDAELLPEAHVADYCSTVGGSRRDRFRRSRLYLPGNTPRFFPNAGQHGADGYILDLEDAVAPSQKDAARVMVRNALRVIDFGDAERMVRINQGQRGLDDLEWIVPQPVQLVLIPKVESPDEVRAVDERVQAICERIGRTAPVWLMPIVESARGALRALEIAEASPNTVALAIGLEDYTADIGVQRTEEGTESFWMRGQIVNAARAAGVQPIDTVYSDVANREGLRKSVHEAKMLGFDGKGCIHPRQIDVVHEAFAPSAKEVDRARKIVLAFDAAEKRGSAVVSLGSKMIDPPVVKRAERTVGLAEAMGLLAPDWREEVSR